MKKKLLAMVALCLGMTAVAQPNYNFKKLKRETLDRGVIAIRQGGQVIVSWRTLTSDKTGEPLTSIATARN